MAGEKPAARITDLHVCPESDGPVPHVGGPIIKGDPTVLIGGLPAARVGDQVVCVGPPDTIVMGSPTVLIGGMPAARMGDQTGHGGVIVGGMPTVLIGTAGAVPVKLVRVAQVGDGQSSPVPDPNGIVPGGPWTAAGNGQKDGTYFGPKQVRGGRSITRWVPPHDDGGPPGSQGYWKTKTPGSSWRRYDQQGKPITPEEAHPNPMPPSDSVTQAPDAQEIPEVPEIPEIPDFPIF